MNFMCTRSTFATFSSLQATPYSLQATTPSLQATTYSLQAKADDSPRPWYTYITCRARARATNPARVMLLARLYSLQATA